MVQPPLILSMAADRLIRWLPAIVLAGLGVLWLAQWPLFPPMLDPAYHLLIAKQVAEAGGPIVYEWWEASPDGRVHLYPPALHLVLAVWLGAGAAPVSALRLMSIAMAPALLISMYFVARRLFGRPVALASALMGMLPFSWLLLVSRGLASGLASIELLWFMASLAKQRWIAACCLLALMWYTHLGVPWVALASCCWWYAFRAINHQRRVALLALGGGTILGLPWLAHVLGHASLLRIVPRQEDFLIEVMPLLYLLAAFGAYRCMRQTGLPRLLPGLWLGFCLFAYPHPLRWLAGEALLPIVLLAAYGAARIAERAAERWNHPRTRWAALFAISTLVALSPSLAVSSSPPSGRTADATPAAGDTRPAHRASLLWPDATPFHLLRWPGIEPKDLGRPLCAPGLIDVARLAAALSQPQEILWSNATYTGGLIAALAHRPMASAMLYEVAASRSHDPMTDAHLIVWFKFLTDPPQTGTRPAAAERPETERGSPLRRGPSGVPAELTRVLDRSALHLAADHELAWLFRHSAAGRLAKRPEAVVPWWVAFVLLCSALGLACWDIARTSTAGRATERWES